MTGRWAERFVTSPWRWMLLPAWMLWRPPVNLRNTAYDHGWLQPQRLPVPVICVGNLSAGGTGKTPTVAWLGALLQQQGRRPAVISRGYGGHGEAAGNDEARMLHLPVHCNPNRYRAGLAAIAAGADCLLMDDGFQHRQLFRDLDLVCLDATRPWGRSDGRHGGTLPLGLLREGPQALRRADAAILTRCDQAPAGRLDSLRRDLAHLGIPVVSARHRPSGLRQGDCPIALSELRGRRVLLVSAIGHPVAFAATAQELGADIVSHQAFPDHHAWTKAEQAELLSAAEAEQATLLITAKDAVKWQSTVPWVLDVVLDLPPEDAKTLTALVLATLASSTATPR